MTFGAPYPAKGRAAGARDGFSLCKWMRGLESGAYLRPMTLGITCQAA